MRLSRKNDSDLRGRISEAKEKNKRAEDNYEKEKEWQQKLSNAKTKLKERGFYEWLVKFEDENEEMQSFQGVRDFAVGKFTEAKDRNIQNFAPFSHSIRAALIESKAVKLPINY